MSDIDSIMEQASERLLAMDYIACERLCLKALDLSRQAEDFETYARILLPLQEARRQRRQIAVEAGVTVLGDSRLTPENVIAKRNCGCLLLLSPPYTPEDETAVRELARTRGLMIEVLAVGPDGLRQCFEQQMEREGDAAVAQAAKTLPVRQRVDALAAALNRVGDHEIAHQRLAEAAKCTARTR